MNLKMNNSTPILSLKLLFSATIISLSLVACTPKKLSSNYGDNKTYADEDSTGGDVGIKEKQAKMPFDTGSVAPKIQKSEPKYDNQ